MKPSSFLLLSGVATLLLGTACHPSPSGGTSDTTAPRDSNWIGEVRITAGDTVIRLCGTGKRYRLTGTALDSIVPKYRYFNTRSGQWMKVWCAGHLGVAGTQGRADSTLITGAYQHLDASLECDPVPDVRIAGAYAVDFQDPTGQREVRLDLFPNGDVTMYSTQAANMPPVEETGRWGLNSYEDVVVKWPQRDQAMKYRYTDGRLTSAMPGPALAVLLRKGPADRLHGSFGRAAHWLATEAAADGHPTKAGDLLPTTPLASLFPDADSRARLRVAARDTLGMDDQRLRLEWDAVTDVQGVVALMRLRLREPH